MNADEWELHAIIRMNAGNAIYLDSQDLKGGAIKYYQRAISAINELVYRYPNYKAQKVYWERANAYGCRIKALKMMSQLTTHE